MWHPHYYMKGRNPKMNEKGRARLRAMPYIKGNKKRVIALIVSLSMFVILSYFVSIVIGSTQEPFYQAIADPFHDMSMVCPVIEVGEYETIEEWNNIVIPAMKEQTAKIEKVEGVTGTIIYRNGWVHMKSIIGQTTIPCYLVDDISDINKLLNYKQAKLVEGRMPKEPGEILIDEKLWNNQGEEVLRGMSDNYKIVGRVESDIYIATGLALPNENDINVLVLHPDDGTDYAQKIRDAGIDLFYSNNYDSAYKGIYEDVGSLEDVEKLIQICTGVLLAVCLLVVLSLHIMDRHEEWCLMNSIGFTQMEIYGMALRELLFCFLTALLLGAGLSVLGGFLFENLICSPMGISVSLMRSSAITIVAGVFVAIYGCCQIPLFVNIRRVCTVDMIE